MGTKLLLAQKTGIHGGVGVDLVAMCVNDLIVQVWLLLSLLVVVVGYLKPSFSLQGAEPVFFLDYYATGKLDLETAPSVVKGFFFFSSPFSFFSFSPLFIRCC